MARPFDVSKLRKSLTKSVPGMSIGFHDPTIWISTGNYALNYLISGDFYKGVPLGKVTVFAGESGCLPKSANVKIRLAEDNEAKTVSVAELNDLYHSSKQKIEIETPDGYQPIVNWFDKGQLDMVEIVTENYRTRCAYNHLIQRDDSVWVIADDLNIGDVVLTRTGPEKIVEKIIFTEKEECYDFEVAHPNHRYYGDGIVSHNSGKSYFASANIVKHAQEQGIFVVLIDSENALDESWLQALGVDTDPDKLLKLNMSMIDDVAKTISEFMKEIKSMEPEDAPKVLFVLDSLGMMLTPTDVTQFEKGDMKGDMGRKPKALTALVRNTVNMFGAYNVGMVATNHTYASQDMFDPDDKISGGQGFIYASSIVVAMRKLKLKEDEDGNKVSDVRGIRAACKVMKTRYSKPFESVQVKIPYEEGMNPFSGLFDLFEKKGLLTKSGNSYIYIDSDGNEHKYFRKKYEANQDGILELIMSDVMKGGHRIGDEPDTLDDQDLVDGPELMSE